MATNLKLLFSDVSHARYIVLYPDGAGACSRASPSGLHSLHLVGLPAANIATILQLCAEHAGRSVSRILVYILMIVFHGRVFRLRSGVGAR